MVELAVKGLEKSLKEYEKSPETHPLYPEEWKLFWNRRYKELQAGSYINVNFHSLLRPFTEQIDSFPLQRKRMSRSTISNRNGLSSGRIA